MRPLKLRKVNSKRYIHIVLELLATIFAFLLLEYAYGLSDEKIRTIAALCIIIGASAIVTTITIIHDEYRLSKWCVNENLQLVSWQNLPWLYRPEEWQIAHGEWQGVESFEICVKDNNNTERLMQVAWHSSFSPNPQILHKSK